MSKSEISSWIASSNSGPENSHEQEFAWQRDGVLNDWDRAMEYAQAQLINGKTKARLHFLREELMSLVKHGGESLCIWVVIHLTNGVQK